MNDWVVTPGKWRIIKEFGAIQRMAALQEG